MDRAELVGLLDIVQGHRSKAKVQEILKDRGIASSGTWEEIRERIVKAHESEQFPERDLIAMVDAIEEFGAKHVYLLKIAPAVASKMRDSAHLADVRGLGLKFGTRKFIARPDDVHLVDFSLKDHQLKLKWVREHRWLERVGEDQTSADGRYLTRKFENMRARLTTTLAIDTRSRSGELRIDRAKYVQYQSELERVLDAIDPIAALGDGCVLPLGAAIRPLLESTEVRDRHGRLSTSDGATIDITSSEEAQGFKENAFYKGGVKATGDDLVGVVANVYFLPEASNGKLQREVHVVIDESNQVVFPSTSTSEDEARHVLQRVRAFAGAAA